MGMNTDAVQRLYVAYFNRPADPVSMSVYESLLPTDQVATQAELQALAEQYFSPSAEYTSLYAGMSNAEIVDQLYQNIFGRSAEYDGLVYWAAELTAGRQTVASIALQLSYSAQGTDAQVVANRIEAANAFTTAINTAEEITGYSGNAAAASARSWLATVGSDEASKDAAVAGVDTAVTNAVEANATEAGTTTALTTGADTLTGGKKNDVFNADDVGGNATFTTGDEIDGGAGNDTFNIVTAGNVTLPVAVKVSNVETASVTAGGTITLSTAAWTGLTSLTGTTSGSASALTAAATTNVTSNLSAQAATNGSVAGGKDVTINATGVTTGTVTLSSVAGAVDVNSTGAAMADGAGATTQTQGAISVTGGTTVSVSSLGSVTGGSNDGGDTLTLSAVTVTGGAATTSVSVDQTAAKARVAGAAGNAAIVNGGVTVTDANAASATAAGTISSVTLDNYGASTIDSSAIATVTLSGTGGTLGIGRGALTATPTDNALALNVSGLTGGAITDSEAGADDGFTSITITGTGTASTIANLTAADATTLTVAGDAAVTLTNNTLASLTSVTVTNTAGATLGTTAIGAAVAFTGGDGADSVILSNSFTKAITTGGGNDTVTLGGTTFGTGGSLDFGAGDADTVIMLSANADAFDANATFNTKVTNVEVLRISDAFITDVDMVGLGGVSKVVLAAGANAGTINNLATGATVTALADNAGALDINVRDAGFTPNDSINLVLSKQGVLAGNTVTIAGVETVNISAPDATATAAGGAAAIHTLTLTAAAATSVVVSGNNGLNLTATGSAAVTSFDATGVTANGTAGTDTAANLAVTYASLNTTATASVSIKGGDGNDTLTGNAALDTILGGAGTDTINGGAGVDTLTGGAGIDTFVIQDATPVAAERDTITDFVAGTGGDKLKLTSAATTDNAGAGAAAVIADDTSTAGAGGGAYALTGASSTTSTLIVLQSGASLSSGVSGGDLDASTNGSELLKALTSTDAADAYTGITATTAADKVFFLAYQDGKAYLYYANAGGGDTNFAASEIALIAVLDGIAADGLTAANFALLG